MFLENIILKEKYPDFFTNYTIIKLGATWCGPCKGYSYLHNLENDIGSYKILDIDIDKDTEWINRLEELDIKIKSIPVILIFKQGIQFKRIDGLIQKEEFINLFSSKTVSNGLKT